VIDSIVIFKIFSGNFNIFKEYSLKINQNIIKMGGTESRVAPPIVRKYRNGNMKEQIFPSGLRRTWYEDGTKESEIQPDKTAYAWYPNGRLRSEKYPSGAVKEYNNKGVLIYERLHNSDELIYNDKGILEIKKSKNKLGIITEDTKNNSDDVYTS
jgi:hypothetical protein